jgi:hypothetical protein
MDSSSAHWKSYWQIPPPLCHLLPIFGFSETRPAQQRTQHRLAPAHTPTCRTKKLASTPPELAGAQPAAPRAARRAPRGPTAGTPSGRPRRRGCSSRTAARRGPRSRGAVTSIGLAAGTRIVQAPGLPPAPAPGACRAALQSGRRHGPQFVAAAPGCAGARRFNRARTHVPDTGVD